MEKTSKSAKTSVIAIAVVLFLVGVATYGLSQLDPGLGEQGTTDEGIPVPFGALSQGTIQGAVSVIGRKNGVPVRQVTFASTETSQVLQGSTQVNSLDFVITPSPETMSDRAKLCDAFTSGKSYYGYVYSEKSATAERDASVRAVNGEVLTFSQLFPGLFFASAAERARSGNIAAFETQKSITFADPCSMSIRGDSRLLVIVNDTTTSVTVRGLPVCGDGALQGAETCDDSNGQNDDGCSATCAQDAGYSCTGAPSVCTATCGDGICVRSEQFSPSPQNPSYCAADCARCGNQVLEPPNEDCDDGNASNADTCTNTCKNARCGDTFVQTGEACDDGNSSNTDTCTTSCRVASCGDGFHQVAGADGQAGTTDDEECDKADPNSADVCDSRCKLIVAF